MHFIHAPFLGAENHQLDPPLAVHTADLLHFLFTKAYIWPLLTISTITFMHRKFLGLYASFLAKATQASFQILSLSLFLMWTVQLSSYPLLDIDQVTPSTRSKPHSPFECLHALYNLSKLSRSSAAGIDAW